jgi:hypothetical protein
MTGFKGCVLLRFTVRFNLRFGAFIGTPTQENALRGCATCVGVPMHGTQLQVKLQGQDLE